MGLEFSLSNFIQILGLMSPLFLGTFLVLVSIFNQNIKGLIYLLFILGASVISYGISLLLKYNQPIVSVRPAICNLVDFPLMPNQYTLPNFNSVFIAFTFIYLLMPMVVNNDVNYWIVGLIVTLFMVDVSVKVTNSCTDFKGILVGAVLGIVCGVASYSFLIANELESLLFFNDLTSNNVVCKRPAKQSFKCQLYKNGSPVVPGA